MHTSQTTTHAHSTSSIFCVRLLRFLQPPLSYVRSRIRPLTSVTWANEYPVQVTSLAYVCAVPSEITDLAAHGQMSVGQYKYVRNISTSLRYNNYGTVDYNNNSKWSTCLNLLGFLQWLTYVGSKISGLLHQRKGHLGKHRTDTNIIRFLTFVRQQKFSCCAEAHYQVKFYSDQISGGISAGSGGTETSRLIQQTQLAVRLHLWVGGL